MGLMIFALILFGICFFMMLGEWISYRLAKREAHSEGCFHHMSDVSDEVFMIQPPSMQGTRRNV